MDHNSKKFKDLQDKWYKKLKKEGFEDCEWSEDKLKGATSRMLYKDKKEQGRRNSYFEAKQEYYRLAGQFLHEHAFESEFERQVWELHSDGQSMRKIADTLNSRGLKTNKDALNKIIKNLKLKMVEAVKKDHEQARLSDN